jgi:hypothetical protein
MSLELLTSSERDMVSAFAQLKDVGGEVKEGKPYVHPDYLPTITHTLNIRRNPIQKLISPGRATTYIIDPNVSFMLASLKEHPNSSHTHLNACIHLLDVETETPLKAHQQRDIKAFLCLELEYLKNSGFELRSGDVVKHGITRAIYIYNGIDLVPLDISWGDYGIQHIPAQFSIPQYPVMHFMNVFPTSVANSRYVNPRGLDLKFEAKVEWKYGPTDHGDLTHCACVLRFTYNDAQYGIYFDGRKNQTEYVDSDYAIGVLEHQMDGSNNFFPMDATTILWGIQFTSMRPDANICKFGCPECHHRADKWRNKPPLLTLPIDSVSTKNVIIE